MAERQQGNIYAAYLQHPSCYGSVNLRFGIDIAAYQSGLLLTVAAPVMKDAPLAVDRVSTLAVQPTARRAAVAPRAPPPRAPPQPAVYTLTSEPQHESTDYLLEMPVVTGKSRQYGRAGHAVFIPET